MITDVIVFFFLKNVWPPSGAAKNIWCLKLRKISHHIIQKYKKGSFIHLSSKLYSLLIMYDSYNIIINVLQIV